MGLTYFTGDCAGLSSSKCLPHKTELVPVPIAVTTCTDDESSCTQTCTVVHLLNHTTCHAHCGCDLDYRRCKGEQVSHTIFVVDDKWFHVLLA